MKYKALIIMFAVALTGCTSEYITEFAERSNAEAACVNKLIQKGVARIDIATGEGTCWKEVNGYYK